jgi:hypothetical protein
MTFMYWLFQTTKNKFEPIFQVYRRLSLQKWMFSNTGDFRQDFERR